MKPCESKDWNEEDGDDRHDDHGDDGGDLGEVVLVVEDMDEAEDEDRDHMDRQGQQKHEEVSVIPSSNAVVDPRAVVIKYLYTVVTDRTMGATRRSVELTRNAPFHSNRYSIYFYVSVERGSEVVISILISTSPGYHPRVHESCQREIYEDKKSYDALIYRHSDPELF